MEIISTNIGEKTAVKWRGKTIYTGIFKQSVDTSVFLDKEDVQTDHVVDRKYHGGIDKACYLYSAEAYPYWQRQYPDLRLTYGFFGENLTVKGLDESKIHIGDQYKIGDAVVEVSQPREPCFKLGIRFNDQGIIKRFINAPYPGIYVRVIQPGNVKAGNHITPLNIRTDEPTLLSVYQMIYGLKRDKTSLKQAVNSVYLADSAVKIIKKRQKLNWIT